MADSHDPYSRVQYRRLIAWPARMEREGPLLVDVLSSGPSRRVLDLACGPGEHSRFLHSEGFEVVGVDASEAMLEQAREQPVPEGLLFVEGDLREIGAVVPGEFGGAICLGNALPHLKTDDDLRRFARGLRAKLLPGAPCLLQVLNYERIFARNERTLPVNLRPDPEGGEIVFVRVMTPRDDGTLLFHPITLRLRPGDEPPVELKHAREVHLRGWRRAELEAALREAGFADFEAWGGFGRKAFEGLESRDLVLVGR